MIIVHGTRAFRGRVPGPSVTPGETSTTMLGAWYATVLRWRRPAVLLVNELTLLPLVMYLLVVVGSRWSDAKVLRTICGLDADLYR